MKLTYYNLHKKYHHLWYGRCVVLLYHRVIDLQFDPQLLTVSLENFENHLKILQKNYNCITVDEFHSYLASGLRIPQKSIVISFDDGYHDNHLNARPLLEKYNFQSLFYISTGNLGTSNEFWWDEVERILFSNKIPQKTFFKWDNLNFDLSCWDDKMRNELYQQVLPFFRNLSVKKRESYINELRVIFDIGEEGRETNLSMTLDDLRDFSKSPAVVIGGHTVNHPSLAHLSEKEQLYEIKSSIDLLEKIINKKIVDFSYPFGTRSNYNQSTINICKKLGVEYVAANFPRIVDKRSDKFQFPRFLVRNWQGDIFSQKLKEYFKSDENFTY